MGPRLPPSHVLSYGHLLGLWLGVWVGTFRLFVWVGLGVTLVGGVVVAGGTDAVVVRSSRPGVAGAGDGPAERVVADGLAVETALCALLPAGSGSAGR
jgi:hypothetical protein